jgi:DNA-directed RNA polymerase subunit M/transcription elongation factor TFIIS
MPIFIDEGRPAPKKKKQCPRCTHDEVYFWTRERKVPDKEDFESIQFFRCTKCLYTWRE